MMFIKSTLRYGNFLGKGYSMSKLVRNQLIVSPLAIQSPKYFSDNEKSQNEIKENESKESHIRSLIALSLPKAEKIEVEDISGGCGAMYEIRVISNEFTGMNRVKRHQMINASVKSLSSSWHGCRISARTSNEN
ncbi:hypothetical protein SNEBB_010391 [Seison nebaliae]|nr:hypothetical protein SNEBB_010391 [Seison nebaliae]